MLFLGSEMSLAGDEATVLAYGQTGSGKTYTTVPWPSLSRLTARWVDPSPSGPVKRRII